jgi:hypothetical protein
MHHGQIEAPLDYRFEETPSGGYKACATLNLAGVIFTFCVEVTRPAVERLHARYQARMAGRGGPIGADEYGAWNPLKKVKRLVSKRVLKQALAAAYRNAVAPALPGIARDFAARTGRKVGAAAFKKAYGLAVGAMTGNPASLQSIARLASLARIGNRQATAALWIYNRVAQHVPVIRKVQSAAGSVVSRAAGAPGAALARVAPAVAAVLLPHPPFPAGC